MLKLKMLVAVISSAVLLTNTNAAQIPPPNMKDYQPAPSMSAADFNSSVQALGKQNQDTLNQRVIQTLKSPPLVAPSGNSSTPTTTKKPAAVDQLPPASDDSDSTTAVTPAPAPAPLPPTPPAPAPKNTHDNTSEPSSDNQNITGFGGTNTKDSSNSSWGY